MSDRFKPTRAGVINVWDYVDEEWAFADGRLALRGHNGSGKTKALEVLFPFVLDGVADSRRLDPFSGENRTMKSNLLYRGQDSEYGYAWMEFGAASGETVTLIVGMRAHRNTDGVRMSFYVTGKRLGVDFGLLSADSRPLTEKQLRSVLEADAHRRTATEYRDLVDMRLFGLGRERYAQLLDLLLALRRPLLAKDLDPGKVSDTLTSGLSPVDDDLVQQAARDFENLAAVQKLFDDLTAANAAVGDFRGQYETYLRAHVKFALDRVQSRSDVAAGHAAKITVSSAAWSAAVATEADAEAERDEKRDIGEQLQGRLSGLKNSEEYKAQGRIEDKRREVLSRAQEVAAQRRRLAGDQRRISDLEAEADKLSRRVAQSRHEAERHARDLADAGERSGIADDGFGPLDPGPDGGDEFLVTAKARVLARRDDVSEVRKVLEAIRDARSRRTFAEQDLGRKETAEQEQQLACSMAGQRLAAARQSVAAGLEAWTGRWAGLADTSAALTETLEHIGEPGAVSLAEVFDGRTRDRQNETIAERTRLEAGLRETRSRLTTLRAERDAIAAEKDDAPPASDLRPASREGRPGAPLWQLARFADDVTDADAASIEGALYGAGLLTAWVHPDPALTREALAEAEADGYLVPGPPVTGACLADVLVPEDQDEVGDELVTAVLRSIALSDDLTSAASAPAVSATARFSLGGVHVGARPKDAPEYIGATNRANRRRVRLAENDALIAETTVEEGRVSGEMDRVTALLDDLRRARRELPDTRPVAQAAEAASTQAALLTRARDDVEAARKAVDTAIAEVDARSRQLRQVAAERRMPAGGEDVDSVARAATEFEHAATALHAERGKLAQATEDLAERTETIERGRLEYAEAEAAMEEAARRQESLEEEFRTLEEALQADVQHVLEQIRDTERRIREIDRDYRELDARARAEHDKAIAAEADLRAERQAFAEAVGQLHEQVSSFGDFARPDLRPLVGVTIPTLWPEVPDWPDPAQITSADGMLPADVREILDAFTEAVRGGRQVTEGSLRNVDDRISTALRDFEAALAKCDENYDVDQRVRGGIVTVDVIDDEGRKPVAEFATRIAERAADQGVLLEDRERKVLEDELLAALAQQIHTRVIAARDLTRDMNADTRSKPMSSGISIGIRWAQSDTITDPQRKASRLLERDTPGGERLAELRSTLRDMIREYRASHPRATYREALGAVLDYRSWHAFELVLISPGEPEARLTRARHSAMSGGEKSAAIHLPLFAAANALYSSAKDQCPRMIALDEAFVGIDERYKPDLFGLAVKFDLDLFMTGHDLWVTTSTVPMIAHYDMYHDKTTRTTSSLLILWDGDQLVDAAAGYSDNDALVTELLGLRPTRHAPLSTDATLYSAPPEPDPDPDDEEVELV
jgi:uncharacterized protein (TIGR02680 family)